MSLISVEGIDNCGKTTQVREIFNHLGRTKKKEVILTKEPGGTATGNLIREILLNPVHNVAGRTELMLFMADRAQHFEEIVKPALGEDKIVLTDRCLDSTYAYQGFGRELGAEFVLKLLDYVTWSIRPDITILLDLSVDEALKRKFAKEFGKEKDRIESEEKQFHERIRKGFLDMYEREKERFILIDASETAEQVTKTILDKLDKRLGYEC